ncbi:MAG: hypothetical protein KAS11_05370 [Candidatus Aenigmarchaeota archaeon]|nr:hypothetical protein [Candidatus Aenigmarchaeota archaeon]
MDNRQKDEILMEIAIGKCVSHKLPSYMQNKKESASKPSVAEQVLFR